MVHSLNAERRSLNPRASDISPRTLYTVQAALNRALNFNLMRSLTQGLALVIGVTLGGLTPAVADCPAWIGPPSFGGAADAVVNVAEADKWRLYRAQRERERHLEARFPARARKRYRLEHRLIQERCVGVAELIDLGRGLFLRRFSRAEGYGHGIPELPRRSRFQRGHFGGPDASACVDCHWKGGFAGAGDRVDNTYAFGDGERFSTADARNPPPLWGLGWVELLAHEMSADLARIRERALKRAHDEGAEVSAELITKKISFGVIKARPDGTLDISEIEGVDGDLIVKPFGWKGVFTSLREFVEVSAHKHLGMQSERLVSAPYREVELGDLIAHQRETMSDTSLKARAEVDPLDPDQDGITRELTEGQVIALVSFIATLDTPQVEIPTRGVYQIPPRVGELEFVDSPSFTDRWLKGARLFNEVGCAECHRPYLPLKRARLKIPMYGVSLKGLTSQGAFEINLSEHAARPHPERSTMIRDSTRESSDRDERAYEVWLVPVFSDFKRHAMGAHLRSRHQERGVSEEKYLTRRLWGLRKTSPYLHHGGALTLEEAIKAHGGAGSEALSAVERFDELDEDARSSLRLFLKSLSRGPAIRIR